MMWNMMSHTEFQIEWTRGRPFFIKVDAAFVLNIKGEDGDTFSRRLLYWCTKKGMLWENLEKICIMGNILCIVSNSVFAALACIDSSIRISYNKMLTVNDGKAHWRFKMATNFKITFTLFFSRISSGHDLKRKRKQ